MTADYATVDAMKVVTQAEIYQMQVHYIDHHIYSEREMELIQQFAEDCCMNIRAIDNLKIVEDGNER